MTTSNRISVRLAVVCLLLGDSTGFVSLSQPKRAFGGSSLFSTDASVDATAAAMDAVAAASAAAPSYDPAALKAYDEWRLQNAPIGMPAKDFDEAEFRVFEETFLRGAGPTYSASTPPPAPPAPPAAAATTPVVESATTTAAAAAAVPAPKYLLPNNCGMDPRNIFDMNNPLKATVSKDDFPSMVPTVKAAGYVAPPKPNVAGTNIIKEVINGQECAFIPVNKLNAKHRSNVY